MTRHLSVQVDPGFMYREQLLSQMNHSAQVLDTHAQLCAKNWASYIITLEFYNSTQDAFQLSYKILHGKMYRGNEYYLYNEQNVFLQPGKNEIISFGKGDVTAYGIEVTGRVLCLKDNNHNAIVLHDGFYWYAPYKLARACEIQDESRADKLEVLVYPPRHKRDLSSRRFTISYWLLSPPKPDPYVSLLS